MNDLAHMASFVYKHLKWIHSFVLLLAVSNLGSPVQSQFVHQNGPCRCTWSNKSVVDLSPLSRLDGNPVFSGVLDGHNGSFEYSPCKDFSKPSSDSCQNAALCRENTANSSYTTLGDHHNVTFGFDGESSLLYLWYWQYLDGVTVKSYVFLICTPHSEENNLTAEYISESSYHLHLFSRWACPVTSQLDHSLSTGSILCITFLSLLLGYFCTGILYRRVVHESTGMALIPHHGFWTELPGLIRDGYLFFISPCLGNNVRYQAYRYEPL